jgi:hypothetical protein
VGSKKENQHYLWWNLNFKLIFWYKYNVLISGHKEHDTDHSGQN